MHQQVTHKHLWDHDPNLVNSHTSSLEKILSIRKGERIFAQNIQVNMSRTPKQIFWRIPFCGFWLKVFEFMHACMYVIWFFWKCMYKCMEVDFGSFENVYRVNECICMKLWGKCICACIKSLRMHIRMHEIFDNAYMDAWKLWKCMYEIPGMHWFI